MPIKIFFFCPYSIHTKQKSAIISISFFRNKENKSFQKKMKYIFSSSSIADITAVLFKELTQNLKVGKEYLIEAFFGWHKIELLTENLSVYTAKQYFLLRPYFH